MAALCCVGRPLAAQEVVAPPTPNADALADQMRILSTSPRDVPALIAAGELSTKLGDPAAALGFFSRAQIVAPSDPHIAAGRAGALVLLERPGEALRLFDQAERAGLSMAPYLAQRGLAYDLVGQTGYAQRDYRRALLAGPDDETVRRLALSLGISGQREEAMVLLDPLLRRQDRAAWRARACIVAMGGDVAEAQKIATSMMAGGAALSPFFARLQALSPADRAYAVHFGEVKTTIARSNDARLAPGLAALPPVSGVAAPAPTIVASAQPFHAPVSQGSDGRRATSRPVLPTPASTPTPSALPPAATKPVLVASAPVAVRSAPVATPTSPSPPSALQTPVSAVTATRQPDVPSGRPPASAATIVATRPRTEASSPPAVSYRAPVAEADVAVRPLPPSSSPPAEAPAVMTDEGLAAVGQERHAAPTVAPASALPSIAAPAKPSVSPGTALASTPEVRRVTAHESFLAGIIGSIAVPASELGVPPPVQQVAAVSPARAPVVVTAAPPAPAARAAREEHTPARTSTPAADEPATRAATRAASRAKAVEEPEPVTRKGRVEDEKPSARGADAAKAEPRSAARKADPRAEPKKLDPKKPEPKKAPDPAKQHPARWWVQVAGGARASDLDKDWSRLSKSSALRGKSAYVTPQRATNRLLTGPFQTEAEARAVVNALAKGGTSAFTFQSTAGQKVEKLEAQ